MEAAKRTEYQVLPASCLTEQHRPTASDIACKSEQDVEELQRDEGNITSPLHFELSTKLFIDRTPAQDQLFTSMWGKGEFHLNAHRYVARNFNI